MSFRDYPPEHDCDRIEVVTLDLSICHICRICGEPMPPKEDS